MTSETKAEHLEETEKKAQSFLLEPELDGQQETTALIKALYRRLNREVAARKEAELLLHSKASSLAQANARLKEQASSLQGELFQSKEQLWLAQQACKFATFAYQVDDRSFETTGGLVELLGFKADEEPTPLEMIGRIDREAKGDVLARVMNMLSKKTVNTGGEDQIDEKFLEDLVPIKLPDGSRRYLEVRAVRIATGLSGREIVYGAVQDATEKYERLDAMQVESLKATNQRSELEETVRALREELGKKEIGRNDDIGSLLETFDKLAKVSDSIGQIASGIPELNEEIAQQIAFAKTLSASLSEYIQEKFRPVASAEVRAEVVAVASEILEKFEAESQGKAFGFQLSTDHTLGAEYRLDVSRLTKALDIMLRNATDASDQGLITLSISEPQQDLLLFGVNDEGSGIPAADQERVFQEFVQVGTEERQMPYRIGLGLSRLKRLANSLGGSVSLSSEFGVGTRVELLVPATRIQAETGMGKITDTNNLKTPSPGRKRKILLVEDEVTNEIVARKMLEQYGCEVHSVRTGEEGLQEINLHRYDLILLDIRLPGIDGLAVARAIRSRTDDRSSVPLLALTAHVFADDIQECFDAGFDEVSSKPIFKDELFDTLDALFDRHADTTKSELNGLEGERAS